MKNKDIDNKKIIFNPNFDDTIKHFMDEKKNKKTITKKTFKYLLSKEVPKEKLDDNSSFGYYDNQIKTFTELLHKKENNNGISQQTPDKPTGFWGD